MPVRPYAPAGPSIHPTIYILARGPFALCQAILIPIYHLFLRRSFFSISPFFLGASFFFKPFDSNWFLSRPLIRTPFVLSLSIFLSSSRFFPRIFVVLFLSLFFLLSLSSSYEYEFVLLCRLVRSNALSYSWLPRGRGFAKERRTTTSEKGAAETSDRTRHLHALLHMRRIARDPTAWKIDR